jgi:hypothetical protein
MFGTPEDIRAATPLMNAQKRLVLKSTGPEND